MENISWSEDKVNSVIKEFYDEIEGIRVKCPEFQHFDFVKNGLLYLKQAKMAKDWTITDNDETALSVLDYFNETTVKDDLFLVSNEKETVSLKKTIQKIYDATLGNIPDEEQYLDCYRGHIFAFLIDQVKKTPSSVFSTYEHSWYSDKNNNIFVKGWSCLFELVIKKVIKWEDQITCRFDNLDDAYLFYISFSFAKRQMIMKNNTVYLNHTSGDECVKYDGYFDADLDYNQIDDVLTKLKPRGFIVGGISEAKLNRDDVSIRNLFAKEKVRRFRIDESGSGWIEIVAENGDMTVSVFSSEDYKYHEIMSDSIARFGLTSDISKYDVFEKVDGFITNMTNLQKAISFGYEESMASFFLVPYFKMYYKDVLHELFDDYSTPDFDYLEANCSKQHDCIEKIQVIRAFKCCIDKMGDSFYFTEAMYQQYLNAIRMIDTIDDDAFQKYYPEVIEKICENVVSPTYISQYHFVEALLGNIDNLQIVVRKDDLADILYPGDFGIDEQSSYAGWGSLLTPKSLNVQRVDVEMAFDDVNFDEYAYTPICSAAQYVIFNAFDIEGKYKGVWDVSVPNHHTADVVIDLHKDVRQYEQLSKKRLNSGGRYVTFAMRKDMEDCQPVIEHLVKENLLEKVISLNNRYLLFISQSKQDDKVVLAKFNHVDDERWLESYQDIIDELALNADSKHVRILSLETLAANNYSFSTDQYFVPDPNSDIKTNIHSIVSQLRNKYDTKDILLNIMLRVATLRNEGKPFSVANWDNVKKLNDVLSSMKESEEILMEHYTECLDFIMEIYGSDTSSQEFYQPEVAKLMADLIESDTVHKLYNPFAGLASFACLFPHSNYYGDEINESVFSFGSFHLDAKGLLESARYTCGNSFQFFKKTENELFDTILTIPPFLPQKETSLYDFLFSECMDHLEENGKMTVVLPAGFTFNRSPKIVEIRKKIVENHWVEKVISLPGGIFRGTNVNTCIIQLSKCANTEIVFCDATQLVEKSKGKVFPKFDAILSAVKNNDKSYCFSISYSSISENNNSLNPITYKPFPEQDGTTTYKLGELLTKVKWETVSVSEGLVLGVDMLSSDVVEYRRDISDLRMEPVNDMMIPLHGEALLLSPIQGTLRPTYVEVPKNTCYHVKRNLLAFKVESAKVLPAYICYALTQPEVSHQIDNYRAGMLINSEDLLNVWINLPDITTQRNIVGELARQRYAEKKQELDKMYGTAYAEKEEEFKSLKHAMGKSVAGITAAVDNLYNYFAETGQLDTIVHKRRASTLGDKLNVIQQSVQHIAVLLKHGADFLDVSQYPMKPVTIDNLWNCIDYETDRFMLNKSALLDESIRQMTIRMNIDLFRILVNDILSNAEKHAFEDNNPSNTVRVEYDYDNTWFTLFISNNGQPFPDDVDVKKFTKRYWSAGNHQGSGIGGHDILKIMTAFQGEFELMTDYEDSYPTCYVLRFPIE